MKIPKLTPPLPKINASPEKRGPFYERIISSSKQHFSVWDILVFGGVGVLWCGSVDQKCLRKIKSVCMKCTD